MNNCHSGSRKDVKARPKTTGFILCILMVLVVAACGEAPEQTPTTAATTAATAAATATTAAAAATQVPATNVPPAATATRAATAVVLTEGTFQNPVIRLDFPDPFILEEEGRYYAYATNGAGRNVQVAVSEDLVSWKLLTDAMPSLPPWARGGYFWAPEVIEIGEQYVLYYTARDKASDRQCIGVATSDQPEGKFRDTRDEPLVCQVSLGGSIDASPFRSGDRLYLYWKNDGNCCGRRTWIYVQELAPDGLSLVGEPVQLVTNDQFWEGGVVEAPTMIERDGKFYLFYSGNNYGGLDYAIGVAVCETEMGPCQDDPDNPLVETLLEKPPVIGPGHQTVVRVGDEDWLVYHAWEVTPQGLKTDRRLVWLDRLVWQDGEPVVEGPTTGPQEAPEP